MSARSDRTAPPEGEKTPANRLATFLAQLSASDAEFVRALIPCAPWEARRNRLAERAELIRLALGHYSGASRTRSAKLLAGDLQCIEAEGERGELLRRIVALSLRPLSSRRILDTIAG